jgi:hypothetical protein
MYEVYVKGVTEVNRKLAACLAILENPASLREELLPSGKMVEAVARQIAPHDYAYPSPPWDEYGKGYLASHIVTLPGADASVKIAAEAPYARKLEYGGVSRGNMHFIGMEGDEVSNVSLVTNAPHPFMLPAYEETRAEVVMDFAVNLAARFAAVFGA